jgi:clan AA aspartic protease (TIGR02281 family)
MISWALKMVAMAVIATAAFAVILDLGGNARLSDSGEGAVASRADDDDFSDGGGPRRVVRGGDRDDDDRSSRRMRIPSGPNGQFFVEAQINGKTIPFLVDTGASDIMLTSQDARRLGFSGGDLNYTRQYQTANGITLGAPVTLRKVKIRGLTLYNLDATVNGSPMSISLLGMGFLNELRGYEVKNETLTLRW